MGGRISCWKLSKRARGFSGEELSCKYDDDRPMMNHMEWLHRRAVLLPSLFRKLDGYGGAMVFEAESSTISMLCVLGYGSPMEL